MKPMTAAKTKPVIAKVNSIIKSIPPQLEAIGVHHQGENKWNKIDPARTRNIKKMIIGQDSFN